MKRAALLAAAACALLAAGPAVHCRETVRIGVFDTFGPEFWPQTLGPALEHLRRELPDLEIQTEILAFRDAGSLQERGLSFFVSTSALFWSAHLEHRATAVAVRRPSFASDPDRSTAAVVVAPAGRADIGSLKSLDGKKLAVAHLDFDGEYLAFLAMMRSAGREPEKLGGIRAVGRRHPGVVTAVLAGTADAGLLGLCELEAMEKSGAIAPGTLRVIEGRTDPSSGCRHTSPLYPNTVIAAMPGADAKIVTAVATALYTMPEYHGQRWSYGSDFTAIDDLCRTLALGSYAYLQEWTPRALWRRFSTEIMLAAALALAVAWHIARVNRMVFLRTAELRRTLQEKEALEAKAGEIRERLSSLERAGIVGLVSGLIAHELKQPLGAITNYCSGLLWHLKDGRADPEVIAPALARMSEQANRASEIIEYVRSLAKKPGNANVASECDLAETALKAAAAYRLNYPGKCRIACSAPGPAPCLADPRGIELALYNLVKNAAEAAAKSADPKVEITVGRENGWWRANVADNGPPLTESELSRLERPAGSVKEGGLGLGLLLVRALLQRSGGKLRYSRNPEAGLTASVLLPELSRSDD